MEHHRLSFYQPQYAPSYVDADQAKIDEIFASCDQLNTPTIDPDFFEGNLFRTTTNEKIDLKSVKADPIVDDFSFINVDVSLNPQSNSTTASVYDRSANYSPYSEKLESSAININSPEMMPVSPNKVCPLESNYAFEDDPTTYAQMTEYEQTLALYSSPAASSHCNSRSSSISSGSGDNTHSYEYLFADSMDPTMNRVPQSPASISSHYSNESTNKTFTNLDNVPTVQMVQIKQEPVDLYQPTTIEEFESVGQQYPQMQQQQQHCLLTGASYTTVNPNDIYYQYSTPVNSLPSTVTSAIAQQQQQQMQQAVPRSTGQASPSTSGNRKRNANAAFTATTSASAGSSSSNKKPRMTKREKQKMMESDISKFETENRDLRTSIDLLERQIQFCKRFLSENVAPVIQRQQQMGQHQFSSQQQMVLVNEA